jgi:uroporphyrinogen decarboxylase
MCGLGGKQMTHLTEVRLGELTPDFERFRTAVLCRGEPDHVPFADVTVYQGHKSRFIGRSIRGLTDEIEFAQRVGYDFISVNIGLHQAPALLGAMEGKHYTLNDAGEGAGPRETVERRWAEGGVGAITSEADFEAFDWPDPDTFEYSVLAEADKILPSNMKVILVIGKIFNPVWWLMGFEQFGLAVYDNPALVERMFERVGTIQCRVLERALEHRCVGAHWHADDVAFNTSLMVSPEILRRYAFPWYRRMVDLCHECGALAICHSDGNLDPIVEDLIDIGFDGLNPIQPEAMDIVGLKKRVQGRLGLLGNIGLGYTLTRGTPQEVEAEVKKRIRDLAPGGGYCLSSANSIPDYVPLENYLAMRDAWLKYGRYPIQID